VLKWACHPLANKTNPERERPTQTEFFLLHSTVWPHLLVNWVEWPPAYGDMGQARSKEAATAADGPQQRQQEFVAEVNRVSLERQIQLQNQMRQRLMAMQVARARELCFWLGAFYAVATVGMVAG
jgi:hypothetical protein